MRHVKILSTLDRPLPPVTLVNASLVTHLVTSEVAHVVALRLPIQLHCEVGGRDDGN